MTITAPINLGDRARDTITDFEGIVTGECRYLTGCVQLLLAPVVGSDGALRESQWFDTDRVELVDAQAWTPVVVTSPGPDRPAPRR